MKDAGIWAVLVFCALITNASSDIVFCHLGLRAIYMLVFNFSWLSFLKTDNRVCGFAFMLGIVLCGVVHGVAWWDVVRD